MFLIGFLVDPVSIGFVAVIALAVVADGFCRLYAKYFGKNIPATSEDLCPWPVMPLDSLTESLVAADENSVLKFYVATDDVISKYGSTEAFFVKLETYFETVRETQFSPRGKCPGLIHIKLFRKKPNAGFVSSHTSYEGVTHASR